ncbi:helix-turn-helix transcriptional regulator [Planctomycetota bacterium]
MKFDINHFSEQQKKILAVFFQNQDMSLSYVDIGRILNKSPHTIKNQMREIRLKADLFDRTFGEQSRHRFKLKKDLRIEKYLNVG